MKTKTKMFILIGILTLVTVLFLIGTQSYFNNKEIELATDKCYEIGGTAKVKMDLLSLSYSFSCEVDNEVINP
ncbi:hypothetical protein GGQ92_002357 [Gracilibacillus halotolerans]|uniref:Uncharacterized protein n=1 Tax=Gracilibacillus halotolerans TaxID=74386 RepID=A0A841RQR2_9BACI|nr:hypothetical protein [Gracilibacillus halotolerans]MBB6513545.1 hypothetical protein [Gracilibacillus halotolerans]